MADFLKKDVAKRDMDFFSVFTATKKKATRVVGCTALVMGILFILLICFIIFFIVFNIGIENEIRSKKDYIESDECKAMKKKASDVALALQDHNSYLYALTSMEFKVTSTFKADAKLKDTLQENLPRDVRLNSFSVENNTFNINGETFSYYAPAELVKLLNDAGVFCTVDTINVSVKEDSISVDDVKSSVQNEYTFTVSGSLNSHVYVSTSLVSSIDNQKKALGAVEISSYDMGDTVSVKFPSEKFTPDNRKLVPTGIIVNDKQISAEKFSNAMISCSYDDVLTSGTLNVVVVYELEEVVNSKEA